MFPLPGKGATAARKKQSARLMVGVHDVLPMARHRGEIVAFADEPEARGVPSAAQPDLRDPHEGRGRGPPELHDLGKHGERA